MDGTIEYAAVGGLQLAYEVHGTGAPLVLLHGGITTTEMSFGPLIPLLAAGRRVIGVELQGHGHTADTDRPMSFERYADDVADLLDHLGLERADVLGFSLGGITALTLGLRRPERVRRLVVISVDHRPGEVDPGDPPPMVEPDDPRMPTAEDFQAMRDAYARTAPDPDHFDAFFARTSELVQGVEAWSDAELAALTVPTLVVVGDNDFTPVRRALELSRLVADGQLAVLPGTTHMDVTRSPRRLAALVLPFLDDDPATR